MTRDRNHRLLLTGPDAIRTGNGPHVVFVLSERRESGRSDQVNNYKCRLIVATCF